MRKTKPWRNDWEKPKFEELVYHADMFSNWKISIFFCENTAHTAHYVHDRDYLREPEPGNNAEAFTCSSPDKGYCNVYFKHDAPASTIAHEAYHAACAMCKFIGAIEEHEIIAYTIGFIVEAATNLQKKVAVRFTNPKPEGHNADHRPSSEAGLPSRSGRRRGRNERPHKAKRRDVRG